MHFRNARSDGLRVGFNWIYRKALTLHRDLHDDEAVLTPSIVTLFLRTYAIKMRVRQRKKAVDKLHALQSILR